MDSLEQSCLKGEAEERVLSRRLASSARKLSESGSNLKPVHRPDMERLMPRSGFVALALATIVSILGLGSLDAQLYEPSALMSELEIAPPGQPPQSVSLEQAMRALNIPSVGISVIDEGRIAWTTVL